MENTNPILSPRWIALALTIGSCLVSIGVIYANVQENTKDIEGLVTLADSRTDIRLNEAEIAAVKSLAQATARKQAEMAEEVRENQVILKHINESLKILASDMKDKS